jgi:hypothetical protein
VQGSRLSFVPAGYARAPVEETTQQQARRARWLLAAGAVAGLVLASTGLFERKPPPDSEQQNVAAIVNGTIIPQETYQRALSALDQDTRDPLSARNRKHVLDRLIEEELLVQRAIVLGFDRTNPGVRNTLVSAMIEMVVSGVGRAEPEASEVLAFYEENRGFFARSDRFWVRQLRFPFEGSRASQDRAGAELTARDAAHRLRAGEPLPEIERGLGGTPVLPVPDGYLPAAKLREYLGPTPAARATEMETGEVSDPIEAGGAWHVLQMVDHVRNPARPLAAVESQVRAEMRRRAGDESLRSYLAELRADATVDVP